MITNFETTNVLNAQIMGLSTDTKPTTGVQPNSLFWELDTNGMYFFDGTQWQPIGGSGGGGGGESDFSTATLHIINSTGSSVRAYCPIVFDNNGDTYAQTRLRTSEEEQDFTVILYGTNGAYLSFQDEGSFKYTISGDIESADQEYPDYWVTGDCTVTVTQAA